MSIFDLACLTKEDIPAWQALERTCFGHCWSVTQMTKGLEQGRLSALGVRSPAGLQGYAAFSCLYQTLEVLNLGVAPPWRGQGLGRRLLEAVLDRGHCQGAVRGILEVGAQNKIALRLYYNFGFQVVGRRIGYYPGTGEDALLLEADLRIRQFGWEANPCLQPASIQGLETRLNR